jgi:hypothetical protein
VSGDAAPVSGCAGLIDPRVAAYARSAHVAGSTRLVQTWIPVDVSGCPGLIQPGISSDTRRADVSGRTRLIEAGIAINVACRARLVDPGIAGMQRAGNADGHQTRDQCGESALDPEQTILVHDVFLCADLIGDDRPLGTALRRPPPH